MQYTQYLLTGATGFLGRAVAKLLTDRGASVRALVCPNDPLRTYLDTRIEVVYGDVTEDASLDAFFRGSGTQSCVIHCAGIVSVASQPGKRLFDVNVGGTAHMIRHSQEQGVGKFVYVSTVHAIPEKPNRAQIQEVDAFSPRLVHGAYAQSKAEATALVLQAAHAGLNTSVVHPSGIIGPGDLAGGSITGMLVSYLAGKLPFAVQGGYDFVDVRDVAQGIVSCAEKGVSGRCYILSGRYVTVQQMLTYVRRLSGGRRILSYLPLRVAALFAPIAEKVSLRRKTPLYFTPLSVSVLASNGNFSHARATAELGYEPRPMQNTLRDTLFFLRTRYRGVPFHTGIG